MLKNNKGQSLIEYITLVAFIAVGSMGVLRHISKNLNHKLAQVSDVIQGKKARDNSKEKIDPILTSKKDLSNFFEQASSNNKGDK